MKLNLSVDSGRLAAYAFLVIVAVGAACSDAPSDPVSHRDDAAMTRPNNVSPAAQRARDRVHKQNRLDWVGIAHNKALDDFREQLQRPGRVSANLCAHIIDFMAAPERVPAGRNRTTFREGRSTVAGALGSTPLCGSRGIREVIRLKTRAVPLLPLSEQLLQDIESAIDASSSSYDLAIQLQPIVDAAAGLDSINSAVVLSTASVAQSSSEYWEVNLPAYTDALSADYSSCAQEFYGMGYDSEDARQQCLNPEARQAWNPFGPQNPRIQSVGKIPTASMRACYSAWAGWKRLAKADAKGARDGYFAGLIKTKTNEGAVALALGAAAAKSAVEITIVTWDLFWCAME